LRSRQRERQTDTHVEREREQYVKLSGAVVAVWGVVDFLVQVAL
jgi:hypothetical protein